tara:strand:+ start:3104 stop:3961 length:858 start_codon:yes stop_codon:yes gene_type:complete
MVSNTKFRAVRFYYIFIFSIFFLACPEQQTDFELRPISNQQFTYHQETNQLYYGVEVEDKYEVQALSQVKINWYATTRNNNPDTLILYDDGTNGDILIGDGFYGLKIANDSTAIQNRLGDDSGYVYLDYLAIYGTEIVIVSDSFRIGNIIPRIVSISAPDTIVRPSDATVSLHLISAEVFDADGLQTIKMVGFSSYHVDGDSMMNNGNYLYLHDDGSSVILYEPDFTSGDLIAGDGIYSFRIPVYGTGFSDPGFQTKPGSFIWRFLTQDQSNDYSKVKGHAILIQ